LAGTSNNCPLALIQQFMASKDKTQLWRGHFSFHAASKEYGGTKHRE
jgi:hypothetical protein